MLLELVPDGGDFVGAGLQAGRVALGVADVSERDSHVALAEPGRRGRGCLDAAVLRELVLHALGDVQEAGGLRLDGCGYVRRPLLHMRNRPL